MELIALKGRYAVAQYSESPALPPGGEGFVSLSISPEEVSLVCLEEALPGGALRVERGWRALRVAGSMEFSLVGVLASLSGALAEGGVSIFAVSTYDTDYLLIKEENWALAVELLTQAGNHFTVTV